MAFPYGGSQARGQIRAIAASLHSSNSTHIQHAEHLNRKGRGRLNLPSLYLIAETGLLPSALSTPSSHVSRPRWESIPLALGSSGP